MEATGVYHEQLAWFLFEKGLRVSIVLPNKAKKYLQSLGLKSKNDKIDAKGLAQMGGQQSLTEWKPISKNIYLLRDLTRELEALKNQKTVLANQLHAKQYKRLQLDSNLERNKKHLKFLKEQIKEVEAEIEQTINKDNLLARKVKYMLSVPGVGLITVATVIAETDGFALVESAGQLTSYAGYDVVESQSGKKNGKTKISKKGNCHIRRIMFFPAFATVTYQVRPFIQLYKRLTEKGKTKMEAYVAIQRKLLILLWVLWEKEETFNPSKETQNTSGIHESKPIFPVTIKQKQPLQNTVAAQDELPCNQSPEALFPVIQI